MMTDDEMKAIASRVGADDAAAINSWDGRTARFAQACVDRERLLAEVQRLRAAPAADRSWHLEEDETRL